MRAIDATGWRAQELHLAQTEGVFMSVHARAPLFTSVLIGGSLILLINFALRASFGVFQIPIAQEFNWPRAEFSLAIAIQNLAWGIGQPIFGALAEKFGDRRAVVVLSLIHI